MKKLRVITRLVTVIMLVFLTVTVSFAWLAKKDEIDPQLTTATVIKQYFHCGTGDKEDDPNTETVEGPYVITRPIHYYNLVQLYQRTSAFAPKEGEEDVQIYFQLGYDLDGDSTNGLEVYDYGADGKPIYESGSTDPKLSKELNMEFYSGSNALLPIGTSEIPFNDIFDGSNLTVKNLHITATETVGDTTYGTSDIGIFGYVTGEASITNTYFSDFTIDLSGTDPEKTTSDETVHNIDLHISEQNGDPDTVYVGYIAGHVKISTKIKHVYINNCKIIGGDAAKSGYGYFGCVELNDGTEAPALGELVANLHTSGDGAGFGGSIDMKDILNRLVDVFGQAEFKKTYGSLETITIDERRGTRSSELSNYSKITIQGFGSGDQQNKYNNENDFTVQSSSTTKYYFPYTYYSSSAYDGEYYFYNRTSMESQGYKFELLVGENKLNKKNVITYTYMDNNGIDIDAWLIKDNDVYLSNNGMNIIEETTEANAAKWMYEAATGGGYYIYTYVKTDNLDTNVKYYLNKSGTYGLTLSATKLTVWNRSSDTESSYLYTNVSGTNYYLDYMNEWRLTPYLTTYYMKYGDNYLSNNGTTLINTTSVNNATQWVVSNPTGDTTFLTVINNNIYYLSFDGSLTLGTSSYTWKKEGNGYYTTINDINVGEIRYDLIFDGSAWKTVAHSGKKLNDGNGHYLTAIKDGNNVRVDSANEANALIWQFTNNSGNTKIYTVINGNVYYLTYSNGLKMDSSGVTWTRNGNSFYFNSAGTNYYLTYDNGWTVISLQYMTISDGNGNYLKVNGSNSFSNVTTAANATHFYSNSLTNGNSTGSIYCIVGGVIYYLYNNNCVLETSDSASTTWQNDGSGNLKVNGSDIWLGYSSESASWSLSRAKTYYYIKSGTNYLTVNSNNDGITNSSGSPVDASKWIYNNSRLTSGYFSGTVKYLRINVTSSSGCTTTYSYALQYTNSNKNSAWSLNNNQLSTTTEENNKQIYLRYNSGWTYSDSSGNASNITMVSNTANAYIGIDDVSPSPSIMVVEINNNPNSIDLVELNLNYLNISTTLQQELLKTVETGLDGGYKTYFPIKLATDDEGSWYDANDPYKVSMKNTGYIIGGHRMMNSDQVDFQKASGDIRISYFPIAQIQDSYSKNALSSSTISYNGNYLILNDEKSDVSSTDDTKKAIEWVFTGSNNSYQISTKVSNKTYYLNCNVSNNNATLSIGTESNTATTWTKNNSNNFYITNGSGQNSRTYYLRYDNGWNATTSAQELTIIIGKFTTIYTVNEDGVVSLPTETAAYTEAKKQLLKTLSNSASVYGLHFMDAQISKEYLLTAPKAVILGRVYDNYEMPLDSIDFHVLERGTINFFAGDYYANNDAFFSLYKIIRGDDNNIEEILEIIEVYEKTQPNQRYIFKFKDSEGNYTFSNADGSYTGATELDTSYKSTPVFKTEWITSPNMSSMLDRTDTSNNPIGNHLYYFEIPCNEGEYCLGSVSGKTGAYLVYLDIASNGGEAINNVISAEGNSVTEAFMHVEYRDRPDKIEANDSGVIGRSLLQLAITAPDNTDLNSFSVNVKFYNHDQLVSTPSLGDYNNFTKGLYVITVVNKSSANVNLDVFLCDDDTITFNDFDYAYRVVYINTTHTTETVINTLITNYDYFKSMGSFTIPFSGDAVESTYTN